MGAVVDIVVNQGVQGIKPDYRIGRETESQAGGFKEWKGIIKLGKGDTEQGDREQGDRGHQMEKLKKAKRRREFK